MIFHAETIRQFASERQAGMREEARRFRAARSVRSAGGEREARTSGRQARSGRGSPADPAARRGDWSALDAVDRARTAGTLAMCGSAGTERPLS